MATKKVKMMNLELIKKIGENYPENIDIRVIGYASSQNWGGIYLVKENNSQHLICSSGLTKKSKDEIKEYLKSECEICKSWVEREEKLGNHKDYYKDEDWLGVLSKDFLDYYNYVGKIKEEYLCAAITRGPSIGIDKTYRMGILRKPKEEGQSYFIEEIRFFLKNDELHKISFWGNCFPSEEFKSESLPEEYKAAANFLVKDLLRIIREEDAIKPL